MEVYEALKQSGNYAGNPDNYMGWGIPDYELASSILTTVENKTDNRESFVRISPNPFKTQLNLTINLEQPVEAKIEIINISGKVLYSSSYFGRSGINEIPFDNSMTNLPAGIYFLKVKAGANINVLKLMKQ
ncbi:MAG: T9SS type A sorting domain-containing protein [Chlorobi bacterium]|nr:T9SS type A sorting domain-containing protein [Chlorobiota bacterium]